MMTTAFPLARYRGQRLCLASNHQKGKALARPFRAGLGMILESPEGLDTDVFGSFCGQRPRLQETRETCRTKTEAGLDLTGLTLGLGSEGSFGPHPSLPWLAAGLECLTFVDREAALVIQEWAISARTNFSQLETRHIEAIDGWLRPRPQAAGPPGVASRCSRPTSTPRC